MCEWLETVVTRSCKDGKTLAYAYWPVPVVWHEGGLALMANHITRAVTQWYQQHGGFDDGAVCYRPVVRLVRADDRCCRVLGRHFSLYGPDDHRQFTSRSLAQLESEGSRNGKR